MPEWAAILLALAIFAVLVAGVALAAAAARRRRHPDETLEERLATADRALAAAHAEDRGWDRELLEAAARAAFAERYAGLRAGEPQLVQVIDRPGTEEDRAMFRFDTGEGEIHLELARHGDTWSGR